MDINTLYDSNSTMYVLGALLRQPIIIHQSKYTLSTDDFDGFRKIIFGAIYNLSIEGATNITPQDIDIYLKQFQNQYDRYKKDNGYEWLLRVYDLNIDANQFDYYYERIKKFTILRDLQSAGIDTTQFYNPDVGFLLIDQENAKLNDLEINDIFKRVKERISDIEEKNIGKDNLKVKQAGEGIDELLEGLSKNPEVGAPLDGHILNFASRGARLGKMYLYSGPSGSGKTRFFVGQACAISMPYIKNGKIIIKDNLAPVLFIATEMDPDEIQTLILAYISGVNEEKMLTNTTTLEEKRLIRIAANLMKEYSSNFIIEKISDPSISTVRSKITNYILRDNINYIFYDYIFTSPALNLEFARTGLREDVTLMMLANTLKEIASDYHVFIYTGTQVSREWEKRSFRNENTLAGSKAIADKADFGCVGVKVLEEEYQKIEVLVREGNYKEPNMVLDIYKNRRGRVTTAKLYRIFDHGTCRTEDLFITDISFRLLEGIGIVEYDYTVKDLLEMAVDNRSEQNGKN